MVVYCDSYHITIVKDHSKFMYLESSNKYDNTAQVDMKLNKVLKELRDKLEVEV